MAAARGLLRGGGVSRLIAARLSSLHGARPLHVALQARRGPTAVGATSFSSGYDEAPLNFPLTGPLEDFSVLQLLYKLAWLYPELDGAYDAEVAEPAFDAPFEEFKLLRVAKKALGQDFSMVLEAQSSVVSSPRSGGELIEFNAVEKKLSELERGLRDGVLQALAHSNASQELNDQMDAWQNDAYWPLLPRVPLAVHSSLTSLEEDLEALFFIPAWDFEDESPGSAFDRCVNAKTVKAADATAFIGEFFRRSNFGKASFSPEDVATAADAVLCCYFLEVPAIRIVSYSERTQGRSGFSPQGRFTAETRVVRSWQLDEAKMHPDMLPNVREAVADARTRLGER
ncbi:hypothetical protein M885DRAFT_497410 [Pelagophyceae sp. CCMP2097]|nr:hypothetical protein M885DRAFT_497410 [Pelagophyceae sp. CCMP2097]